ncbi:MAG: GNAT family N-acetyltransferase, partial [Bryobacteraceae bacterium]
LVADPFQGKGLGAELTRRLIQVARDEKIERLVGDILPDNVVMLKLCERLGFKLTRNVEDPVVKASYEVAA